MAKFEFNTGVRPESGSKLFGEHEQWRNGVKVILVYADVPEGSELLFACDHDDLTESKAPGVVVAPITGGLLSKFGYFRLRTGWISSKLN